jgi:hypothetical protein
LKPELIWQKENTMAEFEGVNVTKFDAGTSDTTWIDQGLIKSSIRVWSDVYEATGEVAGTTLVIAVLPAGAIVHGISIQFDALGAATVDVGDSDDPNRYKNAVDVSSAGSDESILPDGAQYVIGSNAGDDRILITTASAAINNTIKSAVFYTN